MRVILSLLAVCLSSAAGAQLPPPWEARDPRIQNLEFHNDQVVRVRSLPGFQVTIELAPDEQIQTIVLGDSSSWQVAGSKGGNRLFVKPLQANVTTNLMVATDVRVYSFELTGVSEPSDDLPFILRFRFSAAQQNLAGSIGGGGGGTGIGEVIVKYRLRGSKALYPKRISDDGVRTFIEWLPDGPLPAVYAREGRREILLNGYLRGKFFVVDGVERQLVFRIDRQRASAERFVKLGDASEPSVDRRP